MPLQHHSKIPKRAKRKMYSDADLSPPEHLQVHPSEVDSSRKDHKEEDDDDAYGHKLDSKVANTNLAEVEIQCNPNDDTTYLDSSSLSNREQQHNNIKSGSNLPLRQGTTSCPSCDQILSDIPLEHIMANVDGGYNFSNGDSNQETQKNNKGEMLEISSCSKNESTQQRVKVNASGLLVNATGLEPDKDFLNTLYLSKQAKKKKTIFSVVDPTPASNPPKVNNVETSRKSKEQSIMHSFLAKTGAVTQATATAEILKEGNGSSQMNVENDVLEFYRQNRLDSKGFDYTARICLANQETYSLGYTICCSYIATTFFSVTPKMGILSPGETLHVIIKSKRGKESMIHKVISAAKFSVKMFQKYGSMSPFPEYYDTLSKNHPELIFTQTFENVIRKSFSTYIDSPHHDVDKMFIENTRQKISDLRVLTANQKLENCLRGVQKRVIPRITRVSTAVIFILGVLFGYEIICGIGYLYEHFSDGVANAESESTLEH